MPMLLDQATATVPFHALIGIELTEWRLGFAQMLCRIGPQHMNRSGVVHRGVLLALQEQAAAFSGLFCTVPGHVRRSVTVDLDCRFSGMAKAGDLIAEGRLVSSGRKVFFARTEIFDEAGTMVAFGASTHRFRSGSEAVTGVPA